MSQPEALSFTAHIGIIGINPFVFLPEEALKTIFGQAGKEKGSIPVKGTINGKPYTQTLVKYGGAWRLYINTSMLKDSPQRIGETVAVTIAFDPQERTTPMPLQLAAALKENPPAQEVFEKLSPSRQKEIMRYINYLKNEKSINKNVAKAIRFLLGKEKFAGRDKP